MNLHVTLGVVLIDNQSQKMRVLTLKTIRINLDAPLFPPKLNSLLIVYVKIEIEKQKLFPI